MPEFLLRLFAGVAMSCFAIFRPVVLFLVLFVAFAASTSGQTDAWLEVCTPHFVVVSNSSEKDVRRVSRQFERMRLVFQRVFPAASLDTPTPIVVLAVESKRNMEALEPEICLHKGQANVVGLFLQAPEKNYVLIWQNAGGLHPFAPIYHEYAHFVLGGTGARMPLWLSEGWAEFYQNIEIANNEVRIGKVDAYTVDSLQRNQWLPMATLLAVDRHSPYYHEEDKISIFYAEAWALTYYLKTKDIRENTHRILDYLDLIHKRVDSVSAASQAFGDLQQLQADLRKYVVNGDYSVVQIPVSADLDDSSSVVRNLTQTEADTVRADFLAHEGRLDDARTLLETVLREDPQSISAHESMGYIAFRQRNYDEAHTWYAQAVKLDSESFLAHYYVALSAIKVSEMKKRLPDASGQASIETNLRSALKLSPSFAPASDGLGVFLAMRGKDYDEAHQWIQKAIQMDPGSIEFRIDDANVLMRMNRSKDAIDELEAALKMVPTPEQTSAMENMLQVAQRAGVQHAKP